MPNNRDYIDAEFVKVRSKDGSEQEVRMERVENMSDEDLMPIADALGVARDYVVKYCDKNPPAKIGLELGVLALLGLGTYFIFKLKE